MDTWGEALAGWREWMQAAGRPRTTMRLRTHQIRRLADDVGGRPGGVTPGVLTRWLASHDWSTETLRSHRSALVVFFRWCAAEGIVTASPAAGLPAVRPARPVARPAPDAAMKRALLSGDARVTLMVELAGWCGLRRAEIAQVHRDDLSEDAGGWTLLVHGKGGRERIVPVPDRLAERISESFGWLFPGRDGGHLSPDYVGRLVARALPGVWTAHTLRHRFATKAYAGSRDIVAVQELLGHGSLATTRRYVRLPDDALRSAASWAVA